jgi:serine/threonine-protein kinase
LQAALADRYSITRELGRGATATVYLAQDLKHPGALVAIKVLAEEFALVVRTERFVGEIQMAARLTHPHILKLLDSGSAGGLLYYVMPYIDGGTVADRLERDGPLPMDEAVRLAREVADALDYAHSQNVTHRDIKPGNILLASGHAWVADFGIASAIEVGDTGLTATGAHLGTPPYMSPEQVTGDRKVDGRTDIYSLGCTLFEMLCGETPFQGPDIQTMLRRRLVEPSPSVRAVRPDLPAWLDEVLLVALATDAVDRFPTARTFGEALAQEGTRSVRVRRPPSRQALRRALAALLPVGLTLAVVGAWVAWRNGGTRGTKTESLDPRHIAVLYFDDFSPAGDLAHIAGGLTHDLIDELAHVKDLHVISPEGVRPFHGANVLLDSVAHALGVGTIVSGSVAKSGDRLRVSVRMVDPMSRVQLLSQTVERPLADLFALEDQITQEVAAGLRQRLGTELRVRQGRTGTNSVAAWELVQRANRIMEDAQALGRAGQEPLALRTYFSADGFLAQAERLDKRWTVPITRRGWIAQAVALLPADVASAAADTAKRFHMSQWFHIGLRHAARALAVRANEPEALELRGVLLFRLWSLGDVGESDTLVAQAERDLRIATDSNPSLARAWQALADLYLTKGRLADGYTAARSAFEADAYLNEAPSVLVYLFFSALNLERRDEAYSWCEQGRARFVGDPRFSECRLMLLGWFAKGRDSVAKAWQELDDIERRDSLGVLTWNWAYRRMMVAMTLARTGLRDSALAVIRRAQMDPAGRPPTGLTVLAEASARLLLGQRDGAVDLIRACVAADRRCREIAAASPWFRALHADPKFRAAVSEPSQAAP